MGKMNMGRVVLGGIVAGIFIDLWEGTMRGVVLRDAQASVMNALGKPEASMKEMWALNVVGLLVGLLTIWLYAAIRPRLGAGPKTAVMAGLFAWAMVFVLGVMPDVVMRIVPTGFSSTTMCAEGVMMIIAGLLGGALYKEVS